ncbi:MAG: hypothetical protein ACRDSJ_11860 [Rubrobacteraceae bacterium]
MPKLFEIFGYRVDDRSREAEANRKAARCPFMGCDCDGGGNRYLSQIDLDDLRYSDELKSYFKGRTTVPSGVCSIQSREEQRPWIVCPRRLLVLGREGMGTRAHQGFAESMLIDHSGFRSGMKLGVWSEVKVKYETGAGRDRKSFGYTFDYVVMPVGRIEQSAIERNAGEQWSRMRPRLVNAGFSFSWRDGIEHVEDFPQGEPLVVEIMTSSTSSGNKRNRTTIPQAFEDAILNGVAGHNGPGINYRQVWARMVSQLIVKAEAGVKWGGKTIWILQDVLADYISSSTALDLQRFSSNQTSEVNILSFSYGNAYQPGREGVAELKQGDLFSGPIRPPGASSALGFQDMIRAPVVPPRSSLIRALATRKMVNTIIAP